MTKNKRNNMPEVRFPEFKDDWKYTQLGKLISKTGKKNKENINLPVYSINNKEGFLPQAEQFEGRSSNDRGFDISIYKIIKKNTFAYNPARINVGSIGYSNELENILISSLYVCFKTNDKLDDTFLQHYLKTYSFNTSVLRYQEGGVRQYLFFENLSKIKLSTPTIPEQTRIADFFTALDKKIALLKEKKDLLEQYKKGIMQRLFAQSGTGLNDMQDEQDYNEPEKNPVFPKSKKSCSRLRFKDQNGKNFPDWEVKKLGVILKIGSGKDYKHLKKGKIPVYGSGGYMNSVNDFLHDGESVCIGRKGTIDKPLFLKGQFWTVDTLFYTYDFKSSIPKFVYYFFLQINWYKYNEASGVPSLSKKTIENINVDVPSIPEQKKIANFLSKIDDKINAVNIQLEQSEAYKKGMLQRMFV